MVELTGVTLENLAGGAAAEQFGYELDRVLRNIADPNSDPEATRKIEMVVAFKPSSDREGAQVIVKVTSKLAGLKPVGAPIWIGEKGGRPIAVGRDIRQKDMFEGDGGIVPMRATTQGA